MVISLNSLTLQCFLLGARKLAVIRISFRSRISIWNSHGNFIKSFGYPTVFKELWSARERSFAHKQTPSTAVLAAAFLPREKEETRKPD